MTRKEQLEFCLICKERDYSPEKGVYCGITKEHAAFENECPDFKLDERAKRKREVERVQQEAARSSEEPNAVATGANWFFWIFGLSLINTLINAFGGEWNFIFSLGITTVWEFAYLSEIGSLDAFAIGVSVVICCVFLVIGIFAHKQSRIAFLIGMILYGLDAIITLLIEDYIAVAVHGYVLFVLFKGFMSAKKDRSNQQFDETILDEGEFS